MKHIFTLEIKPDGSLKVKRCTLVITSCEASSKKKSRRMGKLLTPPQFVRLTTWRMKLDWLEC